MKQYLDLCKRILKDGKWIGNQRTNTKCLTIINADLEYDGTSDKLPLVTTRKSFWKPAIAELLGYIRGYSSAADFRAVGTHSWDANANENASWLANPHRTGEDDMGRVYGVQGRDWHTPDGAPIDQLKKIVEHLGNGIDDRGEIWTFYNPGEFHLGCLRPCMYSHTFSLLNGELYLTSYQRSVDTALGLCFNQVQVYVLLRLMAQITRNRPAMAYHKMVNVHLYENQVELMREQVRRTPYPLPTLKINPKIRSLRDLETWVSLDDFKVEGYQHHEAIKYPFSV